MSHKIKEPPKVYERWKDVGSETIELRKPTDAEEQRINAIWLSLLEKQEAEINEWWKSEIKANSEPITVESINAARERALKQIDEDCKQAERDCVLTGRGFVDLRKYDDKLPSGEPCTTDEVAGLGALNFGRKDPIRKPAVFHDRLYDGIIAGTSDISQDKADEYYLRAMLAEAKHHQLGYVRAYLRYGVVRLVSLFRRVGK